MQEFRRGWKVLAAASLAVGFGASPMPIQIIGPLTDPIAEEFGWGRGDVQLALLIFKIAVVVTVPFIGALADRHGVRPLAIGALAAFGVCLATLSLTPASLLVFYGIWAMAGILGGYSAPVSWSKGVNGWFVERRGLALAIMLTGTGLTATVVPPLAAALIDAYGWRVAVVALGCLPLGLAVPLTLAWFREANDGRRPATALAPAAPADGNRGTREVPAADGVSLSEAVRQYRFWGLSASNFLVTAASAGLLTNLVPILMDEDFSRQTAANIAGALGLSMAVGRIGCGYLLDRFWAPWVTLPVLVLPALAALGLADGDVTASFAVLAAVLIGLATGAELDVVAFLTARYFGLRHYGKLYGLQYSLAALAAGLAPYVFGVSFDRLGTYGPVLQAAAAMLGAGAAILFTLGPYPHPPTSALASPSPSRLGAAEPR